jgi:peroxiredoxin
MVGDLLPDLVLPMLRSDGTAVKVTATRLMDLFKDKRSLLIGHPGAFTRFTTLKQLPEFAAAMPALEAAGVDQVVFTSVNDPFVMMEYLKRTDSAFSMIADWNGDLASSLGVVLPGKEFFCSISRRYLAYVEADLRIMAASCEQDVKYTHYTSPKRALEVLGRLADASSQG